MNTVYCRHCRQPLDLGVATCPHCGKGQSRVDDEPPLTLADPTKHLHPLVHLGVFVVVCGGGAFAWKHHKSQHNPTPASVPAAISTPPTIRASAPPLASNPAETQYRQLQNTLADAELQVKNCQDAVLICESQKSIAQSNISIAESTGKDYHETNALIEVLQTKLQAQIDAMKALQAALINRDNLQSQIDALKQQNPSLYR